MSETESFEQVMRKIRERVASDYWTTMADRLQAAHDREMEEMRQMEYEDGLEDGKLTMDAVHRAVVARLKLLPLDGGSHENLSKIAYAIYPCATGWTCESAAALRDKLIELMGGVNDSQHMERRSDAVRCDSAVSGRDVTGFRASDARGDSAGGYMVSDDMNGVSDGRTGAIGVAEHTGHNDERGDDSVEQAVVSDDGADCDILGPDTRGHAAGRDFHELGVSDGRFADGGRVDSDCGDSGRDFHFDELTITDELRERVRTATKAYDDVPWHMMDGEDPLEHTLCSLTEAELLGTADRIDEQFRRICEQQEAVLQETIERMADENLEAKDERDHWKREASELRARLDRYERHDTAESIVRELTLGSITEEQAIGRIEALRGAE